MKKTISKVIKKVVTKAKVIKFGSVKTPTQEKCPACLGSGLWRPEYTNSPQCSTCVGHGLIQKI